MPMGKVDVRKLFAEFIGTMFLCLAVNSTLFMGANAPFGAFAIGIMLMLQVYVWGPISGGHLNPAVTAGIAISGKMNDEILHAILYPFMQIAGGVLGCLIPLLIASEKQGPSHVGPSAGFAWYDACLVEFVFTFMLVITVLNAACTGANAGNQYFGLAIGFVIFAAGYGGGGVSGGCYNPAVALGKDLASIMYSDSAKTGSAAEFKFWSLIYIVPHLLAAAVASLHHRVVRPEEYGKANLKNCLSSKLVAEFTGTFLLTYTAHMTGLQGVAFGVIGVAGALVVGVYTFGSCSGGHLNPAVTIGIAIAGRGLISIRDIFLYFLAQIVGAVLAAIAACAMFDSSLSLDPSKYTGAGEPDTQGWVRFAVYDILFTFLLVFVVLSCATVKTGAYTEMFGFIIGFVVITGGVLGGVFGANFNPAVAIGVDVGHAIWRKEGEVKFYGFSFLYWVIEAIGAALAAGAFMLFHPEEYKKEKGEEGEGEETEALKEGEEAATEAV